jgi:hypothetical protein
MSNFNQNEDLFNESLLNLYDEQFKYSAFKTLISKKNREANQFMNNILESINQEESDDVKLVVDLSDEMKEKYKQGLLKFDKDKDGKMYAQLRDENNRYGKKLNIKEDIKESDLIFASQLNMITDVLNEIVDTLENVEIYIHNVLLDLHNDRVGLYYSGLALYLEALQTSDESLKNALIAQSLKSLNDAQAQIIQEFKSDIYYLKSPEFLKIKKKKHDVLIEKMQNIHECYQTINRIISLKAMIYFDNNQLSSMMIVCTEYQRFIDAVIKPNKGFLIECDPRDDKLINGIWEKRANTFIQCKDIQKQLKLNTLKEK